MPKYKITAPDGRVITVSGERAPTMEDAQQIFASLPPTTQPKQEKRGLVSGTLHSALNGFSFGLGDELTAGANAISKVGAKPMYLGSNMADAIKQSQDWQNRVNTEYTPELAKERATQKQFEQDHPVASIGGNIAGALANPISRALPVAKGTVLGSKTLAKAAMGALQGAGYGAAYGFGEGEGGVENRLASALSGGKTGAIVGGSIPVAIEGVKRAGRTLANVLGGTSGAGGESLKRAYDAGTRDSQTFKNAMRGKSSVYDVVDDVDNAVRTMEQNASAKYRAMLPDNGSTLKLPEKEFNTALKKATESISGVTAGVDDTAANAINKVHVLAKNIKYNGGMTFDNALEAKKAIDGIIEPLKRSGEKNAVRLLTPIKNALNQTLEGAVPEYGGARAAFRADSRLIDTIKSALTSNDPTTELRKLQGITRQSVAAAQGGKQELGALLDAVSGKKILDAIAGGQVQQWMPRDPLRTIAAGGTALSTHALSTNPFGALTLAAFSPRVLGEGAYKLGQISARLPQANTNATLQLVKALQNR